MSILRYFNKHQGWHDGKRTYNGGGNPISAVTDSISSALGTDGGGGGLLGGLADLDKTVNNSIPGGWYTVGGLAAGGTALAFAPEIAAAAGVGADTAITSAAGQQAFFDALASGASSAEAINAGVAADAAATAAAASQLAGPTYQELGVTGLGEGMAGPTYAELGYTGLNNAEAIAAADAAAKSNLISDALGNVKDANKLSSLLKQGAASGLTSSLGKLAQGAHPYGAEQLQVVRGNQNPFSYVPQVAIQDKKPDLSALAELLKQG